MHFKKWLSEVTVQDFYNLADEQRGDPEMAMLKFQYLCPGIMSASVEHVGDLIHRMTERPTFNYGGYGYVKAKVDRTLRWLTNEYGFGREFNENIVNNAKYKNIPLPEYREKVLQTLQNYAQEHAKLPVYNRAQALAREAAVSLGNLQYNKTIQALRELKRHLVTEEEWIKFAHEGLQTHEI